MWPCWTTACFYLCYCICPVFRPASVRLSVCCSAGGAQPGHRLNNTVQVWPKTLWVTPIKLFQLKRRICCLFHLFSASKNRISRVYRTSNWFVRLTDSSSHFISLVSACWCFLSSHRSFNENPSLYICNFSLNVFRCKWSAGAPEAEIFSDEFQTPDVFFKVCHWCQIL